MTDNKHKRDLHVDNREDVEFRTAGIFIRDTASF